MTPKGKVATLDWRLNARFRVHAVPETLAAQGWRILLLFWGNLINNYSYYDEDTIERDVPYWYGERALTGLLAAAAWMMPEGWSLEEFSTVRGKGKDSARGRGDLWIGWGDAIYTIEAKMSWLDGTSESPAQDIWKKLLPRPVNLGRSSPAMLLELTSESAMLFPILTVDIKP